MTDTASKPSMSRSIDSHRPECPCPACTFRRQGAPGRKPFFGVRLEQSIIDAVKAAPEGPGAYIERLVREDMERQRQADAEEP